MDQKVEKAFEIANLMASMNSQKRIIQEEFNQTLLYFHNGGVFTATEQRLAFLAALKNNNIESIVLIDDNSTPIQVESINDFFNNLLSHYTEATNSFFYQIKKISDSKTVGSVLENV